MVVAKKKVGFWIDEEIADRLDAMAEGFDGRKGEIVAAAISLYLAAPEADKAQALKDVLGDQVDRLFKLPAGKRPRPTIMGVDSREESKGRR